MYEDCEIPEFYSLREPVARKEYDCCECDAPIKKGEKHFQIVGKWNGELSTYRQHFLCMEACMYVRDNLFDECIPFGGLFEHFEEYVRTENKYDSQIAPLRKMIAAIKRRERND